MAKSKFLKYQDKNADGLIDICETVDVAPVNNCPPCQRNPNAIVPDWTKQLTDNPWFNEKYCTMQCTVVTSVTSLVPSGELSEDPDLQAQQIDEYVKSLFDQHKTIAIDSLLDNFNKLNTSETHKILERMYNILFEE